MLIFDFFAGTGSATKAFEDAGHKVIKFELDPSFNTDEVVDIFDLNAKDLIAKYGVPDFIWASPPCTAFSVASMHKHWSGGHKAYVPNTEFAKLSITLVQHTLDLIKNLNPTIGYVIENPRGVLRKLPVLQNEQLRTITYCQYGDIRMKPTDLWGVIPNWNARPMCKNNMPCHEASPRGSRGGTQGLKNAKLRSMIPYELGKEILDSITGGNK
jgi:hypothetical protein